MSLWNREPAMFMAAIQAIIGLSTSFGLNLTGEQMGAIMATSAAILGLVTRSRVLPGGGGALRDQAQEKEK